MIDFSTPSELCPHCQTKLIYQPSVVQWWCQKCKLSFSRQQLSNVKPIK